MLINPIKSKKLKDTVNTIKYTYTKGENQLEIDNELIKKTNLNK